MGSVAPELLAPFVADPASAAILLDFDGTLSPIVDRPDEAVALPGVTDALTAVSERYGVVGVVSGRPLAFLEAQLPAGLALSGLYGLEARRDGRTVQHRDAVAWRPVVDEVARDAAAADLPALELEHKGLSLTLHFRTHLEDEPVAVAWATDAAARTGLLLRMAKRSVELHPPVATDKGSAVEELAEGRRAVCFVGDDVGDLPAFDALDRLARRDVTTLRVAVTTSEAVPAMLERADAQVDGPAGVLALLRALLA